MTPWGVDDGDQDLVGGRVDREAVDRQAANGDVAAARSASGAELAGGWPPNAISGVPA